MRRNACPEMGQVIDTLNLVSSLSSVPEAGLGRVSV